VNPYLNSLNGFGGGFIAFWPDWRRFFFKGKKHEGFVGLNVGRMMN
jgi:hypothetical protein